MTCAVARHSITVNSLVRPGQLRIEQIHIEQIRPAQIRPGQVCEGRSGSGPTSVPHFNALSDEIDESRISHGMMVSQSLSRVIDGATDLRKQS